MTISRAEVEAWLEGIAGGTLDLGQDNEELAAAAICFLNEGPVVAPPTLPPGYLTPHFTLHELTYSATAVEYQIDNSPNDDELAELTKTAELLEQIRAILGSVPVVVSSGFRCEQVNALVGGASNSAHRWGGAADITVPDCGSALDVCRKIEPHMLGLEICQLIYESAGGAYWVHVGRPTPGESPVRLGEAFTICNGTTSDQPFPNGPHGV